jgi:hypothetical protein
MQLRTGLLLAMLVPAASVFGQQVASGGSSPADILYASSEYIQFDDPETVISAIREVYDQARNPSAARDGK